MAAPPVSGAIFGAAGGTLGWGGAGRTGARMGAAPALKSPQSPPASFPPWGKFSCPLLSSPGLAARGRRLKVGPAPSDAVHGVGFGNIGHVPCSGRAVTGTRVVSALKC